MLTAGFRDARASFSYIRQFKVKNLTIFDNDGHTFMLRDNAKCHSPAATHICLISILCTQYKLVCLLLLQYDEHFYYNKELKEDVRKSGTIIVLFVGLHFMNRT